MWCHFIIPCGATSSSHVGGTSEIFLDAKWRHIKYSLLLSLPPSSHLLKESWATKERLKTKALFQASYQASFQRRVSNQGKVEDKGLAPSLISSFFPKKGEQPRKEGDTSLASCLLPKIEGQLSKSKGAKFLLPSPLSCHAQIQEALVGQGV